MMRCLTPEEVSYFVINTPGKWREGFSESVFLDGDGSLALTPILNISLFGAIGHATGLTGDGKGNLLIIDADNCQIYRFTPESQALQRLECFETYCAGKEKACCSDDYWR